MITYSHTDHNHTRKVSAKIDSKDLYIQLNHTCIILHNEAWKKKTSQGPKQIQSKKEPKKEQENQHAYHVHPSKPH